MVLCSDMDRDYSCIPEEDYIRIMKEEAEPMLMGMVKKGKVVRPGGSLYYELFPRKNSRGTIVLCHGFAEFIPKYYELIYYFLLENYQVAMMECRGHGRSFREAMDQTVVHIDNFQHYVEDFHAFVTEVVLPFSQDGPRFLYGHSMGGGIAADYLQEHPGIFHRCILSSPMFGVNLNGFPVWPVFLFCGIKKKVGNEKQKVWLERPFVRDQTLEGSYAASRMRYERYQALCRKHGEFQTRFPSYGWVYAAIQGKKLELDKERCELIQIPVLIFQAEKDGCVLPHPQELFAQRIPDGRFVEVKGAKHELYHLENEMLGAYLREIFQFIQETAE